jgi:hypothetical protein
LTRPRADGQHASVPYEFDAPLWVWDARQTDTWTFVSLPTDIADEVDELTAPFARGFGSVRVEVTVGGTVWRTSIFPSKPQQTYVLPIKKAVRRAERLEAGDSARVRIELLDVGRP